MDENHLLYINAALLAFTTGLVIFCAPDVPFTEQKGPEQTILGIGLTFLLILLAAITFLLTGKLLQLYKPELLPEGLAWIPYWKKPKKPKPKEDKGMVSRTRLGVQTRTRLTTRTAAHARNDGRSTLPSHQTSRRLQGSLHTDIDQQIVISQVVGSLREPRGPRTPKLEKTYKSRNTKWRVNLRYSEQKGRNESVVGIGLLLIVLVTEMFLVTGKLLQIGKPELLPDGLAWIPCWTKPEKPKPDPLVAERGFNQFGLMLILVIVVTVIFLVTGKLLQKYKPELLQEVLERILCWKKPEKPKTEKPKPEQPEAEKPKPEKPKPNPLVDERVRKRKKLREKIDGYRPGSAAANIESDLKKLNRVNINLFGQMSAGKSAFINSVFFAFKGTYEHMAAEGAPDSEGGKTKRRVHYPLTPFITLQDNRGMINLDQQGLWRVGHEIHGERGVDTESEIQTDQAEECHCAVLVYNHKSIEVKEAYTFIYKFFELVKGVHVSSPSLVVTHKDDCPPFVVKELHQYVDDKDKMFVLENYTVENHEENIEKDIELLEFLWKALKSCDLNAYNLAIKNKEKPQTYQGFCSIM